MIKRVICRFVSKIILAIVMLVIATNVMVGEDPLPCPACGPYDPAGGGPDNPPPPNDSDDVTGPRPHCDYVCD